MNSGMQLILAVFLLIILSVFTLADDLRIGVAIITDTSSEILLGEEYDRIVERTYNSFYNSLVPVLVLEEDYLDEDSLKFLDAVVLVNASALTQDAKDALTSFVASGGVVAATFDSGLFNIVGERQAAPWLPELLGFEPGVSLSDPGVYTVTVAGNTYTYEGQTALAMPLSSASPLGTIAEHESFAPFITTDKTVYAALDLFASENEQLEQVFIELVLEAIGKEYYSVYAMDYESIKQIVTDTRSLLRAAQSEYRKTTRNKDLGAEVDALYEESLMWSAALQFAVETRSPYHLPKYVMPASNVAKELYEKASLVQIPYEILKARGTYWEGRVNLFAQEEVPDNPIVFIGASLTERFDLENYFPDLPVLNRGIGGDHASGVWDRKHLLGLEKNPTKVFILIGTNNVLYNNALYSYVEDVEKSLLYIKENVPGVEIYVQSIAPLAKEKGISPTTIQNLNSGLAEMAKKNGFTYVDVFSALADSEGYLIPEYTNDGVHLTPQGYDVWAALIKELVYN